MFIELRWVKRSDGTLQLQQRTCVPRLSLTGSMLGTSEFTEWCVVPIQHGENLELPEDNRYGLKPGEDLS